MTHPPEDGHTVRPFSGEGSETAPAGAGDSMDLHDATSGGNLVLPPDYDGEYRLEDTTLYQGPESRDMDLPVLPDRFGGKYGRWVICTELGTGAEVAVQVPGELLEELQRIDAKPGDAFAVTRCEKKSEEETAPWEVNIETVLDDNQEKLG